ncbi:hypothetical protein Tco_1457629 [Tanacetum coccineum]
MAFQKRLCVTAPASRFEVGESLAAAARQARHALTSSVDYGFNDTVDAIIRASESRAMTAVEEVNKRVTDLTATQRQDAYELHMHDEDAQDDRALFRAQAWSRLEDRSMALEASNRTLQAQVRTLQTRHDWIEWQRQDACDLVTTTFRRIHALEARDRARTRDAGPKDGPADTGSSC